MTGGAGEVALEAGGAVPLADVFDAISPRKARFRLWASCPQT